MQNHTEALESLRKVVSLSHKWHSKVNLDDENSASIEAHSKLKRLGLVFATFGRSHRLADFSTLPRDQPKTSLFDLANGETLEIPEGTQLVVHEAPIFVETFVTPLTTVVSVEYCLGTPQGDSFTTRRRIFTEPPHLNFTPGTPQ